MTDGKDDRRRQSGKDSRDVREQRLKLALRENLMRRKSQARGRDDLTVSSSKSEDIAIEGTCEKHPDK